jgi:hypothetical protein
MNSKSISFFSRFPYKARAGVKKCIVKTLSEEYPWYESILFRNATFNQSSGTHFLENVDKTKEKYNGKQR